MGRQNLLIDADDTLWENNIYFERVIATAQEMLRAFGVDPKAFREHLNSLEKRHIVVHGYGTLNFARSLVNAFEDFLPDGADPTLRPQVETIALGIRNHPLEILDGVPETLGYLARRHSLHLVTKGDPVEQSRKIESSQLAPYFSTIEILQEKNTDTYRDLLRRHSWDPSHTWMIGNSPRSDINPAISAGLNAVFIPHQHTWELEHEEPVRHPRVLSLKRFADLQRHF